MRTTALIGKVKKEVLKCNPPTQNSLAIKYQTSKSTIHQIIHKDLNLKTCQKANVNAITSAQKLNRITNCRKLYEKICGEKSEYAITLDEAYLYLSNCNTETKICYHYQKTEPPEEWLLRSREQFPKGFLVVAAISGRGVLPLIRVPNTQNSFRVLH